MSNQASGELSHRQKIVNCFNGDDFVPVRAIDNIQNLIRTEKLKLLAQVRERVIGEDHLLFGHGEDWEGAEPQNSLKEDQRIELSRLETEL